jgi:hypothetical protein
LTIELPDNLLQQIEAAGVTRTAVDEFVHAAVREKLEMEERRTKFLRLSSEMREAMIAQGLTEEEILNDFEKHRRQPMAEAIDDFDSVCDQAAVTAPGTHLTRDQLHELNSPAKDESSDIGATLMAIRQRYIAAGAPLLSADEIDHEIAERRGERYAEE